MTCDECWEAPCTCREFFKVGMPSFKLDENYNIDAFMSPATKKIREVLSLRTLRDAGLIDRIDFEERMKDLCK